MLKFIIHIKRFLTAFFVTAVIKPIAWFWRLIFGVILVPLYRWYALLAKRINKAGPAADDISEFFAGRLTIHVFVGLVAIILIYANIAIDKGSISPDQLIGKMKLSSLIGSEYSTDSEELIEDYPNLSIAKLHRHFQLGQHSLMSRPIESEHDHEDGGEASPAPGGRTEAIAYTVQSGDTISTIARKFGVNINTILWENNLRPTSLIKPGDQLTILPASGVSHSVVRGQTLGQIAKLYGTSVNAILKANGLDNPNQLTAGARLFIPGATRLATTETPAKSATRQTAERIKDIIGIKQPSSIIPAGGRMVWPTSGHRITQYFSARHTGLDVANKIGTPIYAADSGVVTAASYNRGGYGNQIIINHGGGKTTRYAHLSSFAVRVGQKVNKGQYIGGMGSTGRSTGPHLHFEVIINGHVYNPLNYVR